MKVDLIKKLIISIIAIVLVLFLRTRFVVTNVQGVYVNTNYERSRMSPTKPDTLILMKNGRMESDYFGNSYYELEKKFWRSEILLFKESDKSFFGTTIKKTIWGQTKIMISSDNSHYYLKIN
ncbi:MAG: hypothetical protein AAFO07_28895 [Bacteroidota bacterium]